MLIIAGICIVELSWSQVKKPPVKKPVTTAKPKPPVKNNNAVVKAKPQVKQKPVTTVNNSVSTAKQIEKVIAPEPVPNKPVNNLDITKIELTGREQEMINEINNLRSDPARYCVYVESYLKKYEADAGMRAAANELVAILKKMKPLTPLSLNPLMYNDAKQHGQTMAKKNVFEHSTLPYYENLSLGHKDIREAIVDLLIDDGIPNRGHRNNLLNEKIKSVAVYELPGKLQDIGYCYVQVFK